MQVEVGLHPPVRRRSHFRRLLLYFGAATCLVLLLTTAAFYVAGRSRLETEANARILRELRVHAARIDLQLQKSAARLEPIVSRELASPTGHCPPAEMRSFLSDLLARTPTEDAWDFYITYEHYDYKDPDSDIVVDRRSWPDTYCASYDYHDEKQSWYHQPKVTSKPFLTEPYFDLGSVNQTMVSYTLPFADRSGAFAGVVGVDVLLDTLSRSVSRLHLVPAEEGEGAELCFILSPEGRLIAHPNTRLLPSKDFAGAQQADFAEGRALRHDTEGFSDLTVAETPRRVYWVTAPFTGWRLCASVSVSSLLRPIRSLEYTMLVVGALALILMLVGVVIIARHAAAPIERLAASTARAFEAGGAKRDEDELDSIYRSFRDMEGYQQRMQSANRELESFSYSVSHDLRGPLRVIEGFASLLKARHSTGLDVEGMRLVDSIRHNVARMSTLIDDLLNFSRIGSAELRHAPVDMRALASEVFDEVLPEARRGSVEFNLGELPHCLGETALLRQVWVNLLSNAVKFSSKSERPCIHITAKADSEGVWYEVADNGAGFDMRYAAKLFGAFQRLHDMREFEGTGLGLSIVQRVVTRHGGRVAAEGTPGKGARFRFFIPAKPALESTLHA